MEIAVLLLTLFFVLPAYAVGLVVYSVTKYRYRTTMALVQSREELPLGSAESIVILSGYRYRKIVDLLKFLTFLYGVMSVISMWFIKLYRRPGDFTSGGTVFFGTVAVVCMVQLVASILRIKTMHNDINGFLDENRFTEYDPQFVTDELNRIKSLDRVRGRRRDSALETIINTQLVDRFMPERFAENRLLRKVTGKVVKEIIVKIAVTLLLALMGIHSFR